MAGENIESVLEQLLKTAQAQGKESSAAFSRLARASGLDPKKIEEAEKKVGKLGDSSDETAKSVSSLGKAGQFVGNVLGDLVVGVAATTKNLVNFAAQASSGKSSFSDLFGAFKDLPIIGTVAGLFAGLAKQQEANLQAYRELSKSGINFGQSLSGLRLDATQMGLGLEEYTTIMKKNADAFAVMGGSAREGAKNFRTINMEMTRTGGAGEGLRNLGFGFEELANLTTSYSRSIGGLTRQQMADTKGVTASVVAYGRELDLLARLTGQDRESVQKKVEAQQQEANWQAYLSTQTDGTRDKMTKEMAMWTTKFGEGGADAYKALVQGVEPQTKAGQMLLVYGGKLRDSMVESAQLSKNSSVTSAKLEETRLRRLAEASQSAAQGYAPLQKTLSILALSGDEAATTAAVLGKNFAETTRLGEDSTEKTLARFRKEEEEQRKSAAAKESERDAALDAERKLRDFNATMVQVGQRLINELLNPLLDRVLPWLKTIAPKIQEAINYFVDRVFTPEGRQKIINDFVKLLGDLFKEVKKQISKSMGISMPRMEADTFTGTVGAIGGGIVGALLGLMTGPLAPAMVPMLASLGAGAGFYGGWQFGDMMMDNAESKRKKSRSAGSWGATGKLIENFGSGESVTLHDKEGVVTENQMQAIMSGSANIGASEAIQTLNNTNVQMLALMRDLVDNSRRNIDATKSLSGNAFA